MELLAAMLVSLIVIGGGVYGLSRAFDASSSATSRVTATSNAELELEHLVTDLRDVVNGPSCTVGSTNVTALSISRAVGAGVGGGPGSTTTIQMCDPNTSVQPTSGQAPPVEGVQWQCNMTQTATSTPVWTCARSVTTVASGVARTTGGQEVGGIESFNLQGVVNGSAENLPCDTLTSSAATCTTSTSQSYSLNSGAINSLSSVTLSATVGQLSTTFAGATQTVSASTAVPVTTATALRNFGTS